MPDDNDFLPPHDNDDPPPPRPLTPPPHDDDDQLPPRPLTLPPYDDDNHLPSRSLTPPPHDDDDPPPPHNNDDRLPPHDDGNPPPPRGDDDHPNPLLTLDLDELTRMAELPKLQRSMSFIQAIRNASLDDGIGLTDEALEQLHNPPKEPLCVDDWYTELALSMFIALEHSSESMYEKIQKAINKCFPDAELPSFHRTKSLLTRLSGVTSVVKDMCINSCAAYVGPLSNLDSCPECSEPRYDQVKFNRSNSRIEHPRAVFHMIPIAPQLQSLWRHPESAEKMRYWDKWTQQIFQELQRNDGLVNSYDDVFCGQAYLDAVTQNKIQPDDTLLMLSIDGAQLYESKESDCWIYIWIILELSPDHRYKKKHVLPGTIIPGPKKPKIIDSFLFLGLHHLSAVQREGLHIWDASQDHEFLSRLFLFLVCADGPRLLTLSNFVGHQGKNGCCMLCPLKGCHKPGASQYYPVLLKPDNYDIHGCDHPDVDVYNIGPSNSHTYVKQLSYLLGSHTQRVYEARRLETGIVGPSILLGLQLHLIQGIPEVFSSEVMHLSGANMAALWLNLWRGKFDCASTDNQASWYWAILKDNATWEAHGCAVMACKMYLPGSFNVAPRDPSLHSNSWYKAAEYIMWIYCLCPALLFGILPDRHWRNFCKFVAGLRIMSQYSITPSQLQRAYQLIREWALEFEEIFYQRHVDRIPFIRPCVHLVCHLAPEAAQVGSPICSSQWTMERTIGNLGQEIRQPSDPFSNLAQQGIWRCQVNALKAMIPHLDPPENMNPHASADLGNGYILLAKRDKYLVTVHREEARVIAEYLERPHAPKIRCWACLRLPNGQVARSEFQELQKAPDEIRMARNVKVRPLFPFILT